MRKTNIGILGSGQVAQVLAAGFLKHGCEVMVGTRDVEKLRHWQAENSAVQIGSFEETCRFGKIIVLAVKGAFAEELVKNLAANLIGKTVLDTTNPISPNPPENGVLKYFTTMEESLMERLQKSVPEARFVKVFNSVGSKLMVNPQFAGGPPTMFICGNHEDSKRETSEILDAFGWEVADMGKVEAARALEPLCILWCIPGFLHNRWTHAFKILQS
jgi:predicted dinucleotide-binding enzyme